MALAQKKLVSVYLDDWQPLSVGGLLSEAPDWMSSDIQEEMSGSGYDWH